MDATSRLAAEARNNKIFETPATIGTVVFGHHFFMWHRFGAVDVNVDLACTSLLSPLTHLPPPTSSPPSSAAAGEPM